jgi:ankyrin repeat protein
MKQLLLPTIAAVLVVGCGESQQPEPTTAKAPDISIHRAANEGNIEAVKQRIADGVDVNEKTKDGVTPLDRAIWNKQTETADLLRKHGGKTGAEFSIDVAARTGNIEAVKQHIAAGVDVKDASDATPLHFAASASSGTGHKEIVELLIAKGADVNAKADDGMTPLHFAATGHKEIVELLIAESADVNAKAEEGWTPLHFAAMDGYKKIAELLIAKGADLNAKDKGGKTPLDSAIMLDQTETADLLRKHGGKTGEELEAEGK